MNLIKKRMNVQMLESQNMRKVFGGAGDCVCGCCYADKGGSSTEANKSANFKDDKWSTGLGCEAKAV